MGPVLRTLLLIVAAIVLLWLAIKVVASAISFIFYALAILCIGYVALYLYRRGRGGT